MTSEHLWQLEQNKKQEWPAQDPLFTDREWGEAKMFGQYEQRENREEVVVFRRVDLASYVSMIRTYDAALVAAAEREACAKLIESRKSGASELMDVVRDMEAQAIRARTQ